MRDFHSQQFRHILVIEAPEFRHRVSLDPANYSIGRNPANSIVIPSRLVSRHHATLLCKTSTGDHNFSFLIIDGNSQGTRSSNGLFVNGIRCSSKEIKHGDVIHFGSGAKAQYLITNNRGSNPDFFPKQFFNKSAGSIAAKKASPTLIIPEPSERKLEELNNSELVRLASFPELNPHPIIEIDLQGNITYLNPAASLQFQDIDQEWSEHPLLVGLTATYQNKNGNLFVREVQVEQKIFEQWAHYLPESQLIRSYIFEITERKRSEAMLQYQAGHDLLTGLPNRMQFNEHLSTALANARRNQTQVAVMFLDLDRFKNINDTLGHGIGDQLLQSFAQRLQSCLRAGDTVARWGGDEFTVLLPQIRNAQEAALVGKRVLGSLKHAFQLEEHELYVRTSIGIALYPQDGEDSETLLKDADAALYAAKQRGRNNYRFYSPTLNSEASRTLKLETLLCQALEREEFVVYYQPQVNVNTGKIYGVEALIRWQHPELGLVSPGKFIPIAEETGLIVSIGEWVLWTACAQNRAWQSAGLPPVRVSVNLSPRQFQQPNLVSMVARVLRETGLEPQFLELEITETNIIENLENARLVLENLQQMGVYLSMDDFGTGYSSLGYLKQFPFHTLKIDQSFVRDMRGEQQELAIITAVIALGRAFNLRVVAEGVETQQQLELLRNLQCDQMQGYLFSKPLRAKDVTKLLECSDFLKTPCASE